MQATAYSYSDCFDTARRVNWTVNEVLGDKMFDFSKPFLPEAIAGVSDIGCLSESEKLLLNQIRGLTYAHLFGFVETFIVPQILEEAQKHQLSNKAALRALVHFADEELKHQELFSGVKSLFEESFNTPCKLLPDDDQVAEVVLSKSPLAVMLLTLVIEWFTQRHFVESFKDNKTLDPLFLEVFKAHRVEEAQHAKLDTLEIYEIVKTLSDKEKDQAIDDLIDLVSAVDGLLQKQMEMDLQSLQTAIGRQLGESEIDEIKAAQLKSYRWTFIFSGTTHPNFLETFTDITTEAQQKRVGEALESLS